MPLPASGTITLAQIQTEFGGSNPIGINEYYRGGGLVPNTTANINIPTSGTISLSNFYGGTAFTPVTRTYTTGSGTDTVPTGATQVVIEVTAGGGGGSLGSATNGGAGGGGGGYAIKTIAVTGGNTLSYAVGAAGALRTGSAGAGNPGSSSTVSGTVSGGSVSISSTGGGGGGGSGIGGAGGGASGGDTNTAGNPGENRDGTLSGNGGDSALATGGVAPSGPGDVPGAGGAGGNLTNDIDSGAGGRGEIVLAYT